jgi:hypothetical protein
MTSSEARFASPEVASFWRFIASSISRLVAITEGMSEEELTWRPPAPEANSLNVLAMHTLGNLEENVVQTLSGEAVQRERDAEFRAERISAANVDERWATLRPRVEAILTGFTTDDLDRRYTHPRRGDLTGREVLIVVARHAAEHLGQAELTRDLLRATQQHES